MTANHTGLQVPVEQRETESRLAISAPLSHHSLGEGSHGIQGLHRAHFIHLQKRWILRLRERHVQSRSCGTRNKDIDAGKIVPVNHARVIAKGGKRTLDPDNVGRIKRLTYNIIAHGRSQLLISRDAQFDPIQASRISHTVTRDQDRNSICDHRIIFEFVIDVAIQTIKCILRCAFFSRSLLGSA